MANDKRETHPRETASIFSYLTFIWTAKIFIRNVRETLTADTLWRPYKNLSSKLVGKKLERKWTREVERKKERGKKPNLTWTILETFWPEFTLQAVLHVTQNITDVFMRPILLKYILNYFVAQSGVTDTEFQIATVGMVAYSMFMRFIQAHYLFGSSALGLKVKTAVISLIHGKCLRLPQGLLREVSSGHVVNLVSNDASRFETVIRFGNYLWSTPIFSLIICYQVYNAVGVASIPGLIVVTLVTILQVIGAKFTASYRRKIAVETGKRLRLTEEILNGIHVIKMHAWERPFFTSLHEARKSEMKQIFRANIVRGIYMSFGLFTRRAAVCFTLIVYVVSGQQLNAALVYVLITYFGIISGTLTGTFIRGIQEVAECRVAIRRIEEFLVLDEIKTSAQSSRKKIDTISTENLPLNPDNEILLKLNNVYATWMESKSDSTLSNINVELRKGAHAMVVGPIASGKSSLLSLILSELHVVKGEILLNGSLSYSSQEAWLFNGTVRENILMGLPFNKKRYDEVIWVCSLGQDLDLFRNGDEELVGERGASLSGGQRARINLARAVYREADIYLFDDPLSAVDAHVAKAIFHDCFKGFLRDKTIIIATHQLQFMKFVDHVILLKNGYIEDQGTLEDLLEAGHEYLKSENTTVSRVNEYSDLKEKMGPRWRSIQSIPSCDDSISIVSVYSSELEENLPTNRDSSYEYKGSPYIDYFKIGSVCVLPFFFLLFFIAAQGMANLADYFVNMWINKQEDQQLLVELQSPDSPSVVPSSDDYYISFYALLIVALFIAALLRGLVFFYNARLCSKQIHESLARSVIFTDMSFFNDNPIGAILNRFSRDMNAADELLPKVFFESCQVIGQLVGIIILTAVINYLLLVPLAFLGAISYFLREFFMRTSLHLKRLEGSCRSPVFTHFSSILSGLSTIRAHGSISVIYNQFNSHQDLYTSAFYSFQASQQGYTLLLDMISLVYLAVVILFFYLFQSDARGADVGLALTQTVSATQILQMGLRAASETTSLMTCIERILAFVNLRAEESQNDKLIPPPLWPAMGKIDFKSVSLTYKTGYPVLKRVTFTINPGEKVGIVGRTGAGKSSITQALFRFASLEGEITIDGIPIKSIPLNILRSRIAIIPQQPVLFSGDLRRNLDPFSDHPDYVLLKILDEIEVPHFLRENGLDTKVTDGGLNMSIGQRQLICLARAILRNSRFIILDEATANVDPSSDILIQRVIRQKFAHCTVLTIAHRLNTIMDSDKVMVMDNGRLVEYGEPHFLLHRRRGYFYDLVLETGGDMAMDLIIQAQQNYLRKQQSSLKE